jgi:hypothetical protein
VDAGLLVSWLLEFCFWGDGRRKSHWPDRRTGERGWGQEGADPVVRCLGGRCFGEKTSGVGR